MKQTTIIIFFLSLLNTVLSNTITVKQDSTGNYITIQEALDAAQPHDTILVYPGTYYENINFNGKSHLTLASLNITTNERYAYVRETIIDGNMIGNCIRIENGEDSTHIQGFTIQHGGSLFPGIYSEGGAIRIYKFPSPNIYISIRNCILQYNYASSGGGLALIRSNAFLSGVDIKFNHAISVGGGILFLSGQEAGSVEFDSINRCNIYLNYAGEKGNDVAKSEFFTPFTMYLDTFTVLIPDIHHLIAYDQFGFPINGEISYVINNQKIEPINANLYVNPDGDNNNSGLTIDEPLQSIAFALTKIVSDSLHPNTIYLSDGIYSPSNNDEKFPLNLRSHISIIGESRENTILEGDSLSPLICATVLENNIILKFFTLQGGHGFAEVFSPKYGCFHFYIAQNIIVENIKFQENMGSFFSIGNASTHNTKFINCDFIKNYGAVQGLRTGSRPVIETPKDTNYLINCKIYNNTLPCPYEFGNGFRFDVLSSYTYPQGATTNMINCEFSNNFENAQGGFFLVSAAQNGKLNMINCTMADNHGINGDNIWVYLSGYGKIDVYNSIFYNNDGPYIFYMSDVYNEPCTLNIYNSCVEWGENSIWINADEYSLHYDNTNIDSDPMFVGSGHQPYYLQEGSPCINAGTLNLPQGIELPEFDLAGNPRIWDGAIDMGAYEHGPWVSTEDIIANAKNKHLKAYPNPFYLSTTIEVEITERIRVRGSIYDMQGREIKRIMDNTISPCTYKTKWNGIDKNGNKLPAGTYIVKFFFDEEVEECVKLIKML